MESNVRLVKEGVERLTPGPVLNSCLLLQLEKQVDSIKIGLLDVTQDILSSENENEHLLDRKDELCKTLF